MKSDILDQLQKLYNSDEYPFHMPGHKRRAYIEELAGAYHIDITEIEGYDNLYEAEGMIKEALQYAKKVYKSDETFFLVNGSTVGILSAVTAVAGYGQKLLVSRNCHKSVFHAAELCHSELVYLYPEFDPSWNLSAEVTPQEVERQLKRNPDVKGVLITSPTYEGIVSNIYEIAQAVHSYGIPLIVDEAHGAHFIFDSRFPNSAITEGADVVIQSMHKTLPCFTQTALIHMKKGYADIEKIRDYIGYYQTSSPSYLFMATMDRCIRELSQEGSSAWDLMFREREKLMRTAGTFRHIRIRENTEPCKLVISVQNTNITGKELQNILLKEFHLQVEMACQSYVVLIITAWDTEDGFKRLTQALAEIDSRLWKTEEKSGSFMLSEGSACCPIYKARNMAWEWVPTDRAAGRVVQDYITVYPPGIPLTVPGERIGKKEIQLISEYREKGFPVQGITEDGKVPVCKETNQEG